MAARRSKDKWANIAFIEIRTWGQWAWFQLIKQQVVKKEMVLKKMTRVLQT